MIAPKLLFQLVWRCRVGLKATEKRPEVPGGVVEISLEYLKAGCTANTGFQGKQ